MLEMFILNPARAGRRKRKISLRRFRLKARRPRRISRRRVAKSLKRAVRRGRRGWRRGSLKRIALRARKSKLARAWRKRLKGRKSIRLFGKLYKLKNGKIVEKKSRGRRNSRTGQRKSVSGKIRYSRRKKPMAKARLKGGRRRYRRNAWFRQSKDHAVAAKLGWAYQTRRRKKGGSPRRYIVSRIGRRGLLRYRASHKPARRRRSWRKMVTFRVPLFGRRYKLVANKASKRRRKASRRRYMDNARRRRRSPARGKGGRFVSRRRKSGRRKSYRRNWFVYDDNKPRRRRRKSSRRRRKYAQNAFFPYNDNPRRKRRRKSSSRRRRYAMNGRRRRASGRRYMQNSPVADALDTVKSVFDVQFLTGTALPVVGGFFLTRLVSGFVGGAVLGNNYQGMYRMVGNFIAAGLSGALAGFIMKDPQLAGNILLGGVVNALSGVVRDVAARVDFVAQTPALSSAFGLSGMDDVASSVERQVMRELGVSDFLTAQQLSRAERVGDYLTTQQLSRAENIGQYPAETSGPSYLAQYPSETSGGALADFADVASFA